MFNIAVGVGDTFDQMGLTRTPDSKTPNSADHIKRLSVAPARSNTRFIGFGNPKRLTMSAPFSTPSSTAPHHNHVEDCWSAFLNGIIRHWSCRRNSRRPMIWITNGSLTIVSR
jgi:hypothetical protein